MKRFAIGVAISGACFLWACSPEDEPQACINESQICEDCSCPYFYMPVCGCDGKTYGNACMASVAGVSTFTQGKCP